tara:strand:+ start:1195 stop:1518 length:324 start_codon:yes stop_codon:yes gene_type:complete
MKELLQAFMKLCNDFYLDIEQDSDGLYVPGDYWHTCIFVNLVDEDQGWIRFVANLDGIYYRCDVDDVDKLDEAMSYWLQGDDMDHVGLDKWCTFYHDPNEKLGVDKL